MPSSRFRGVARNLERGSADLPSRALNPKRPAYRPAAARKVRTTPRNRDPGNQVRALSARGGRV